MCCCSVSTQGERSSCSNNDTTPGPGDPEKKKLYEAKLWVKPWLNFKELQNSSSMVMMPLPLLPLIFDAKGMTTEYICYIYVCNTKRSILRKILIIKIWFCGSDDNASGWRKLWGDGLEHTSQLKADFGFSGYNDRLTSTLQLWLEINMNTCNVNPRVPFYQCEKPEHLGRPA